MQILLTNDDGIHAPGIAAMERALRRWAEVMVVAPSTEQSGVSQSITFLRPLVGHPVRAGGHLRGYAVDGTPADCVKLGVTQFCAERPDLIVSGINGGLNCGINILYSGTVGGAMEGALFGIPSFAVSLEYDDHADYDRAADLALPLIRAALARRGPEACLFNINVPTAALVAERPEVRVVPMAVNRFGHHFEKRVDPKRRTYYWATDGPEPEPTPHETDVTELKRGCITLSPLQIDLTRRDELDHLNAFRWPTADDPFPPIASSNDSSRSAHAVDSVRSQESR